MIKMPLKIDNLELMWLGHAGFKIKTAGKVIYVDPYQISSAEVADIILITHPHYDHCSISDLLKISKDGTAIICPAQCQSSITKIGKKINLQVVEPGDKIKIGNLKIQAVPAYNPQKQFHPKSEKWLGFILEMGNVIIYHLGDTDLIPEMERLTGFGKADNKFIALLPVGGNFTMNAEEAAKAAALIKPSIAVPMHFGSVVGTMQDAENFCRLCKEKGVQAQILEKE